MILLAAASNKRLVSEPISLIKLPNINIPIKGTAVGTNKATIVVTAIGKIIFNTRRFLISVFEGYSFSCSFMLIINSFLVQNSQRHIRISSNGNRSQQMGSQLDGSKDSRRTIGTTDNAQRTCFLRSEPYHHSTK